MKATYDGKAMRVFNGQTPDGLECSASLVMRKRGRWCLLVAIGPVRNAHGAVMLPSGAFPYEITMGSPGERRPTDNAIGRALLACIDRDARARRAKHVRGISHGNERNSGKRPDEASGHRGSRQIHESGSPPGGSDAPYGIESVAGDSGDAD